MSVNTQAFQAVGMVVSLLATPLPWSRPGDRLAGQIVPIPLHRQPVYRVLPAMPPVPERVDRLDEDLERWDGLS
jgi:hypothetical protein